MNNIIFKAPIPIFVVDKNHTITHFNQALEEGLIKTFMDAGFCVTNPTCGACLGMSNGVLADGEVAAATTNRNFTGRMGSDRARVFLANAWVAAAAAVEAPASAARSPPRRPIRSS